MSEKNNECISGNLLRCCLYFTANSLARNIGRIGDECFKPLGLSPSHAFVLMLVDENPGIAPKELAATLHLAPSTITRFVDALERKGYVDRTFSGKTSSVYPTQAGQEMLVPIKEAWRDIYEKYCAVLGEDEAVALTRIIDQANAELER